MENWWFWAEIDWKFSENRAFPSFSDEKWLKIGLKSIFSAKNGIFSWKNGCKIQFWLKKNRFSDRNYWFFSSFRTKNCEKKAQNWAQNRFFSFKSFFSQIISLFRSKTLKLIKKIVKNSIFSVKNEFLVNFPTFSVDFQRFQPIFQLKIKILELKIPENIWKMT